MNWKVKAFKPSTDYVYRTQLEYIVTQDCESYALADDVFNTGGMGFAVAENAPYLTAFDLM